MGTRCKQVSFPYLLGQPGSTRCYEKGPPSCASRTGSTTTWWEALLQCEQQCAFCLPPPCGLQQDGRRQQSSVTSQNAMRQSMTIAFRDSMRENKDKGSAAVKRCDEMSFLCRDGQHRRFFRIATSSCQQLCHLQRDVCDARFSDQSITKEADGEFRVATSEVGLFFSFSS